MYTLQVPHSLDGEVGFGLAVMKRKSFFGQNAELAAGDSHAGFLFLPLGFAHAVAASDM